jgi:hypothetical protein
VTSYVYTSATYELSGRFVADRDGYFRILLATSGIIRSADAEKVIRLVTSKQPPTTFIERVAGKIRTHEFTRDGETSIVSFRHCDSPKSNRLSLKAYDTFYKDLFGLLDNYNRLCAACQVRENGSDEQCAKLIIGMLDVNGDGRIAPAEITKFLREASKFVVLAKAIADPNSPNVFSVEFTLDAAGAAQAAAVVLAPWISRMVMENMDYDGNGFITADEVRITLEGRADFNSILERVRNQFPDLIPAITSLGPILGGRMDKRQ